MKHVCNVIVSGQITFEALGMSEVYRVSEIAEVLVDAVISLGKNNASKNWVKDNNIYNLFKANFFPDVLIK